MASSSCSLLSCPEEILERILALCVQTPPASHVPRPSWHVALPANSKFHSNTISASRPDRSAPLLASKTFLRIATPSFYHTLPLTNPDRTRDLLQSLRENPSLASHVRCVVLGGLWSQAGEILAMCSNVRELDMVLDAEQGDAGVLCAALKGLKEMRHLVLRKASSAYFTQERPRYVVRELASAIMEWDLLETANISFRLSDDSATISGLPNPNLHSKPSSTPPITALTQALQSRPNLHTFTTHLPTMWNITILTVSECQSLQRIILTDGRTTYPSAMLGGNASSSGGILETCLYLTQAWKHPRLAELIRAGTPIIRIRSDPVDILRPTPTSFMPPPSSPSCESPTDMAGDSCLLGDHHQYSHHPQQQQKATQAQKAARHASLPFFSSNAVASGSGSVAGPSSPVPASERARTSFLGFGQQDKGRSGGWEL